MARHSSVGYLTHHFPSLVKYHEPFFIFGSNCSTRKAGDIAILSQLMDAIAKALAPVCKSMFINDHDCQSFSFSSSLLTIAICSGVSMMSLYSPSLSDVVDRPYRLPSPWAKLML